LDVIRRFFGGDGWVIVYLSRMVLGHLAVCVYVLRAGDGLDLIFQNKDIFGCGGDVAKKILLVFDSRTTSSGEILIFPNFF
jgi:hypothetical protein